MQEIIGQEFDPVLRGLLLGIGQHIAKGSIDIGTYCSLVPFELAEQGEVRGCHCGREDRDAAGRIDRRASPRSATLAPPSSAGLFLDRNRVPPDAVSR